MKTFNSTMKSITILSLIFVFALSIAWAKKPPKDDGGGGSGSTTYNASYTVVRTKNGSYKGAGWFNIANQWSIYGEVPQGSLDAYMDEQGTNSVTITVEMTEELIVPVNGPSYYKLDFEFGPTGAHFEPDFELKIDGQYVETGVQVWLYDANGDALEGRQEFTSDNQMVFYIPHFSSYSYDNYDY